MCGAKKHSQAYSLFSHQNKSETMSVGVSLVMVIQLKIFDV